MACEPRFEKQISLECIAEIVSDIRNKAPIQVIAEKILWTAGSGVSYIKPGGDRPVLFTHLSDEALLNELESSLKIARGTEASATAINPILLNMLYQLALRWLAKIQF